jgi:hypothetical protein
MHLDRSADNIKMYKMVKKTAKRMISETMSQIYDGQYQQLDMKEGGEGHLYDGQK